MKPMILALTLFATPAWPQAETVNKTFKYNGYGYTFFSVGACVHRYANVGAGGGGEGFLWRGLTIGADLGHYRFPAGTSGYGVATFGLGYHFVNREKPVKIDPFVNANLFGVGFSGDPVYAGSFGGGVNYWFKERIGLHIGAQAQAVGRDGIGQFRIGLAFR